MSDNIISVVAAMIRDEAGRMLVVRKRGTEAFMQPGGKRDAGEDDITALEREIGEELGCRMVPGSARVNGNTRSSPVCQIFRWGPKRRASPHRLPGG